MDDEVKTARLRFAQVLLLGAWFGVLTGFAEALIRVLGGLLVTQHAPADPQAVWMAPSANAVVFLVLALLLGTAGLVWRRAASARAALVVFSFFLFFDLAIFTRPRIGIIPLMLLSAGAAYQLARWVGGRQRAFEGVARRTLPAAAVVVVLVAGGFTTRDVLLEGRARSALSAARSGASNVLLLILDTVRAQSLSIYGYSRPTTPNLERMGANGVVFENAFSTAPWTLPSHASMFTGHYPNELSTGWTTGLDAQYPTLAELLTRNGYRTGGFVANQLYGPPAFGLGRGFAHYDVFPHTVAYTLYQSNLVRFAIARVNGWTDSYYSPTRKTAAQINSAFLSWLSNDSSRPFFAFLNYYDAHDPYAPPEPFDRKFLPEEPLTRRTNPGRHTADEVKGLQNAYDGAITYLDSEIGKLYDELQGRGLLNNTIIIVASDHGEEFAEHTVLGHGNSLYATALHVPLLIIDPRQVSGGQRVNETVTTRDLSATIIDLLGVSAVWPGQSLAHTWNGSSQSAVRSTSPVLAVLPFSKNLPQWYPVSHGDLRSLLSDPYHYIRNGDGREELYDIRRDPWEKSDLAKTEGMQTVLITLRRQASSLLGQPAAENADR